MPSHCCLPGCRSNYSTQVKTEGLKSVFRFPKNEALKQKWIDAIPRNGWTPNKGSVVCEVHFNSDDVIKVDKWLLPDGTIKMIPARPKLKKDAIPCIFTNLRKCMSKPQKLPVCRLNYQVQPLGIVIKIFEQYDTIENYDVFLREFSEKVNDISDNWHKKVLTSKVVFYTLDFDAVPIKVENQISIHDDLTVKVFVKDNELPFSELKWLLDNDLKITRWPQIQNLLDVFKCTYYPQSSQTANVQNRS